MVMKHPKNPGGTTPKSQKPITPHRRNPSHAAIAPSRVLRYTFPWSHRVFLSISACCGARFASFEVSSWGEGAGNATIDRICIYLHRAMVASCRNLGRGVAHLKCQLMKGKGVGKSRLFLVEDILQRGRVHDGVAKRLWWPPLTTPTDTFLQNKFQFRFLCSDHPTSRERNKNQSNSRALAPEFPASRLHPWRNRQKAFVAADDGANMREPSIPPLPIRPSIPPT